MNLFVQLAFSFVLIYLPGQDQKPISQVQQDKVKLEVKISGVKILKGQIMLALYSDAKGFEKEQPFVTNIIPVTDPIAYWRLELKPGTYAVSCFHDLDMNGLLNKNFLGIPRESFAFSNNPVIRFSTPDFKETQFKLDGRSDLKVALNLIEF